MNLFCFIISLICAIMPYMSYQEARTGIATDHNVIGERSFELITDPDIISKFEKRNSEEWALLNLIELNPVRALAKVKEKINSFLSQNNSIGKKAELKGNDAPVKILEGETQVAFIISTLHHKQIASWCESPSLSLADIPAGIGPDSLALRATVEKGKFVIEAKLFKACSPGQSDLGFQGLEKLQKLDIFANLLYQLRQG